MSKVSVVLTTYNEDRQLLRSSIDSILHQDFSDFEIIFVVEPNDKNLDLLRSYDKTESKFRLILNEKKMGFVSSLNQAIRASSSEYIARSDSDDICHPSRLTKQVNFLEENTNIDVLGSNIKFSYNELHTRVYPKDHKHIKRSFLFTNAIAHPTVMFRRDILSSFGYYDQSFTQAEDLELWLRLLSNGCKFHNIQEPLVLYNSKDAAFEDRGRENWRHNYKARLKHNSALFGPISSRVSVFVFWLLSVFPAGFQVLIPKRVVFKIKRVKQ